MWNFGGDKQSSSPNHRLFAGGLPSDSVQDGFRGSIELKRRGFYPKGGGIVNASIDPIDVLSPIVLNEFGEIRRIYGLSYSCRLPSHIVKRMATSVRETLRNNGYGEAFIELECLQPEDSRCASNPGCGSIVFAELSSGSIIGSDSLGE